MRRLAVADVMTGILVLCALTVTGLLIRREFMPAPVQAAQVRTVRNAGEFRRGGQRIGNATAPVTIVEFADFQCPFCRESAKVVSAFVDSSAGQVSIEYRHLPLDGIHPFATMAAVAAECAALQSSFRQYHDALFAKQDSIGKRSWATYARDAGLADTVAFNSCVSDSSAVMPRVRSDVAAARELGITGTPALLIGDQLFSGAPSVNELRDLVKKAR